MVVSTVVFHFKEMVVAATHSTTHHRASIHLSNSPVARKIVTTKIPSPSPLQAGTHHHQAQVALRVDLPHHPLALPDCMEGVKSKCHQAIHSPRLMAITHPVVALRAMVSLRIADGQGIHTEAKMKIHTEDSEIHTVDIEVVDPVLPVDAKTKLANSEEALRKGFVTYGVPTL